MRCAVVQALLVLVLAGCGGGKQASVAPPTTTAPARPAPTMTTPAERAACAELQTKIRLVSTVVSGSVELMTQSLHPNELAARTGEAQRNLLLAAGSLELMRLPAPLVAPRRNLVVGLRDFADDFGKAKASVAHGDIAAAAQQLDDRAALGKVATATKRIDRACGA